MVGVDDGCYLHGWPSSSNLVKCKSLLSLIYFLFLPLDFFRLYNLFITCNKIICFSCVFGQIKRGSVEVINKCISFLTNLYSYVQQSSHDLKNQNRIVIKNLNILLNRSDLILDNFNEK